MASLTLPSLNASTISRLNEQKATSLNSSSSRISTFRRRPTSTNQRFQCGVIRMQAGEEDFELKQMRDMAAAKKRWDAMIREGKVKVLTPREAGYAIQLSNKPLLDVRPSSEREKAWVKGSIWVPIFDIDNKFEVGTLSRKVTNFVMGGWWSGTPTVSYDRQFLSKVEEKFPKDAELIVACQKGLRSLAACEVLCNAGYRNLFWVQGGLEAAEEEDLAREGTQPLKFAGIGGLSEFLGWTDQQRVQAAREGWGYRLLYSARLIGLFVAADAFFIGAQQVGRYLQDLRSH
ncbi:PREDICTED: rhodanese-like domain-containing protein 11, chloroplastic [Theobroma cacao]|uniref:Rhodanese-like domain-containing protein 11, chloroplastic n=1 Tax=Theobroma cacao TaxID=3641 RepID=A0AB32W604_THECC|nr:PREDICTED: rhodanese-like domain-containing protein 11, chloroplastic [Theobroma cacao]